jgi:hypothetical protein
LVRFRAELMRATGSECLRKVADLASVGGAKLLGEQTNVVAEFDKALEIRGAVWRRPRNPKQSGLAGLERCSPSVAVNGGMDFKQAHQSAGPVGSKFVWVELAGR